MQILYFKISDSRICIQHSNNCTYISHASKVMIKILQDRLQQYVNWDFEMYNLDLEKAKEPEVILQTFIGS